MYIRAFELHRDLQDVNDWLLARELRPVPAEELPALGLIIPGVCVGFLRMAEGNLAIVDSLLSNPGVSLEERTAAVDMLFGALVAVAEKQGCTRLWGITINNGAFMRAVQHGFMLSPCVLMVRE